MIRYRFFLIVTVTAVVLGLDIKGNRGDIITLSVYGNDLLSWKVFDKYGAVTLEYLEDGTFRYRHQHNDVFDPGEQELSQCSTCITSAGDIFGGCNIMRFSVIIRINNGNGGSKSNDAFGIVTITDIEPDKKPYVRGEHPHDIPILSFGKWDFSGGPFEEFYQVKLYRDLSANKINIYINGEFSKEISIRELSECKLRFIGNTGSFKKWPSPDLWVEFIIKIGVLTASICNPTAGSMQSGLVPISYELYDPEHDMLSILCEYSTDGGKTWHPATVIGRTESITSDEYEGTVVWNSTEDLPEFDGQVFRITPSDIEGPGHPGETEDFHLLNSVAHAPNVSIDGVNGYDTVPSGVVIINYTATDPDGNLLTTTGWQFSTDGRTWLDIEEAQIGNNKLKRPGSSSITWDTQNGTNNLDGKTLSKVWFRMRVTDGTFFSSYATSNPFPVDNNDRPIVSRILDTTKKGIMLYTRHNTIGHAWNHRDFLKLIAASDFEYGHGVVPTINHSKNPFGSSDSYISIYKGWIFIPEEGDYWFATDSDDASELLIDGQVVATFYGVHGPENGWSHNGKIYLTPGYHRIEYHHEDCLGGQTARAAWKKPGDKSFEYIPEEYLSAEIERFEDVVIICYLQDSENDSLSIEVDFSTDQGLTWRTATVEGDTRGITTYKNELI